MRWETKWCYIMTNDPIPAFRALADPTRREILHLLTAEALTIAQVAERFEITRPAIQKHLTILCDAQLITVEKRGRERLNSLNLNGFQDVTDWLGYFDRFWDTRLSDLKAAIEKAPDS